MRGEKTTTDLSAERDKLRAELAWYRGLLDHVRDCIWRMDPDGRFTYVSPAAKQIAGYEPAELIGQTLEKVLPPESMAIAKEQMTELLEGRLPPPSEWVPMELVHHRKDGTRFFGEIQTAPIWDEEGNLIAIEGVTRDITERKEMERALRESTEYLNATLDALPDLMFELDRQGRFLAFHSARSDLLYRPPEAFIGKTIQEVLPGEPASIMLRALEEAATQGRHLGASYPLDLPSGRRWFELSAASKGRRGSPNETFIFLAHDITESREAELALRQSEAQYKILYTKSPAVNLTMSAEGKILDCNDVLPAAVGTTKEELLGRHVTDLVVPRDRPKVVDAIARLGRGEVVPDLELDTYARDGSIRTGLFACSSFFPEDGEGEPLIFATAIDVTRQKRAEDELRKSHEELERRVAERTQKLGQANEELRHEVAERRRIEQYLRASEEKYRTLVETLPDAVFVCGTDERYTFINAAGCGFLQRPREEIVGHSLEELYPQEVVTELRRQLAEVLQRGAPHTVENVLRIDGELRYFSTILVPLSDDLGAVTSVLGISHEITQRRRAENQLAESEQNFRALAENASDGLVIAVGQTPLRHAFVNRRVAEILGYTVPELLEKSLKDLAHPDEYPKLLRRYEERLAGVPLETPYETTLVRKDGTHVPVEVGSSRTLWEGQPADLVSIRDITERKQAEEARRVFVRSMEQSTDGIILEDSSGRVNFINPVARKLLGLAGDRVGGTSAGALLRLPLETQEHIEREVNREGRWTGTVEITGEHADPVPVELTRLRMLDHRGTPVVTAHLLRDLRGQRRVESLHKMVEQVVDTESATEEAIRRVMAHLPELVGLNVWAIYTNDVQSSCFRLLSASEGARPFGEAFHEIPVFDSSEKLLLRSGQILRSPDVQSDPQFTNSPALQPFVPLLRQMGIHAVVVLPIRSGKRFLGSLFLGDHHIRAFAADEINSLKLMANQLSFLLRREERTEPLPPSDEGAPPSDPGAPIAESRVMRRVLRTARDVSATDLPVIILGPTGAGKGHLAKHIHTISPRSGGPFLVVNCACLDGELILSELFGHERGAFTGALRRQKGCFELANGGTLLLDEVIELPPAAQAKLLQVVETQQFRRLGGEETIHTDVRILCVTNADIRECVRTGRFRQDLYYRLNGAEIHVPPLRERIEDIEPLARAHLRTHALASGEPCRELTDGAIRRLQGYAWPGNVRELQNVLTQAVLRDKQAITADDLHFHPLAERPRETASPAEPVSERDRILDALRRNQWNRTAAAKELGIHRNTLRERIRRLNITR